MTTPKHRTAPGTSYFVTTKCWQSRSVFQVPENSEILIETLFLYRDRKAYALHEFVIMPDHLHLLLTPTTSLEKSMQFIKGGSSHQIRKTRNQEMEIWQVGFHDWTIRDYNDWQAKVECIHTNPGRAKLVQRPEDWPGTVDQPLAIKEQESVAHSFLASGFIFTGILCPAVYRRLNCRSVYKVVLGPGDVFLGEGQRTCSKCQQAFRDRSKEWSEISSIDRVLFLFPMVVGAWMIVAFAACVLFSYLGWTLGTMPVLRLVATFFVMPLIAWFVFWGYQVFRSVRRFSLRGKTKAT